MADVTLHVYRLQPSETDSQNNRVGSFFARMLPSIGLGAFHTSLEVESYRYTFAANAGVIKTLTRNQGVPTGAVFQESISLGACSVSRGQINGVLQQLEKFFHGTSYHLVHRNCNHFTQTLATALILYDELVDNQHAKLKSYPDWVNRLATTGQSVVSHDADIVTCDVVGEARTAVGADSRIGWDLKSETNNKRDLKKSSSKSSSKKTLTEKQKAALAKIRGGGTSTRKK